MPGTPEEYMASSDFSRAKGMIDQAIASGEATGDSILSSLMDAGLRIYPESPMGDEEAPMEEPIGDEMGEEMGAEPMLGEEGAPPMGEEGPSMVGGPEQGNRGLLIEAVRFGMKKDKENKNSKKEEEEQYA